MEFNGTTEYRTFFAVPLYVRFRHYKLLWFGKSKVFDWAFSFNGTEHEQNTECFISKNIQKYLRAFQQGRNIGIPQGSAIFDFIGEIILGYSDLLLHEAIQKAGITNPYEIIRYRDDYRIFCNDKDVLEKISYILQHVLENLNFRMNSKKTKISDSIVTDAVKSDKLAYIYNHLS